MPPLTLLPRPSTDPLILLVDDSDEYRRVLSRLVRIELGFEVAEAANGLQAINVLEKRAQRGERMPDLVVADQRMPGMDGTELLAVIAQRWPEMRRILLSAYTTGEMVVELGYSVLDKQLPYWLIRDEIQRYAQGA